MAKEQPVKKLDASLIISAFLISAIIFVAGIFAGYSINNEKLSTLESSLGSVVRDVQDFQLQFLFLDRFGENASCPMLGSTLSRINQNSYELGSMLMAYGTEGEIRDEQAYTNKKLEYTRLLTSYWLLAEKAKSACNTSMDTVVYFYGGPCPDCENQVFVLSYMKKKYGDKLLVFALDGDLGDPSVNTLKSYYNITEYPSLIINGVKRDGFVPQDELLSVLDASAA